MDLGSIEVFGLEVPTIAAIAVVVVVIIGVIALIAKGYLDEIKKK